MPPSGPVKVLVIDDHAGVRAGISILIEGERPRMCLVGVAASADDALAQVQALQPDVVVLDVDLAGKDGLTLIGPMRRSVPCQVVVLTSLDDARVARRAQRSGAYACIHKTAPAAKLLDSIDSAYAALTGAPAIAGVDLSPTDGDQAPIKFGLSV